MNNRFPLLSVRRVCFALALLCAIGSLAASASFAAAPTDEASLIQVLQSNASPREKDLACAALKRVGTDKCIPALSALLVDTDLSHSARYVLESMSSEQASKALVDALASTSGPTRIGILNSLGVRREKNAVTALEKLLADPDTTTGVASAEALGRIAGAQAMHALENASKNADGKLQLACTEGLLQCANRLVGTGGQSSALEVFERIHRSAKADYIKLAAYEGIIRCSGPKAPKLIADALAGSSGPEQAAALQCLREVQSPEMTSVLSELLPKLTPLVQVAVIEGLAQRADPKAAQAVAAMVTSQAPEVRVAALSALGILGDSKIAGMLVQTAATASAEDQSAARLSLVQLRDKEVPAALISCLQTGTPPVQAEAARALGDRREAVAFTKLAALAKSSSSSAQRPIYQALGALAGEKDLPMLVELVTQANDETTRAMATESLNSAVQNVRSKRGQVDPTPILAGLKSGNAESRGALLQVCAGFHDEQVRAALRSAVADSDQNLRASAIRALSDTTDPELLPDLVAVACKLPDGTLRNLAIGGSVRLTTQEESVTLPPSTRLAALKQILATPLKPEQKRVILAGLAEVPDPDSLAIAEGMLGEEGVKAEAARAVVRLAPAVPDTAASTAALKRVLQVATEPALRQEAQAALRQLEARADFLTKWQAAGPYLQAGKDYAALFDIPFAPETADKTDVKWETIPACTDPTRPWSMDLLKMWGGEQRVGYARTWIHSDSDQKVVLELGSDDGVKVWLNETLVHANNIARPLQPGSDKVQVTLKAGWNSILLKLTQNNLGWEFSARFLKPDGSRAEGLKAAAVKPAS